MAGSAALALALGAALVANSSCGARTELYLPPPLPPEPECDVDADCPGYDNLCGLVICVDTEHYDGGLPTLPAGAVMPPRACVPLEPVDCDDQDTCTIDSCVPETGECEHGPATLDSDGDGHRAPLPGMVAGAPGSCGDDCDDSSPLAYPGNEELCDGVDNDCNGVVDDDAKFTPLTEDPLQISGNIAPAEPGGLAFNGDTYMSIYSGTASGFDMYATRLDPEGNKLSPIEEKIGLQNADSYGGPIVWTGDRYGVAWQDRRDGDYEIYFTLLDPEGVKIIADTRLTNSWGFSVNVDLAWNGSEFVVLWQDDRTGVFEVMAQRVSVDGLPLGGNTTLSPPGLNNEAPAIASGTQGIGVAWANGDAGFQSIRFQTFAHQSLSATSTVIELTNGFTEAVYPTVAYNLDHYVVSWYDRTAPLKAIYAATVSEQGDVLVAQTPISSPGSYRSRYPQILPLGDRALVLYADDRDNNNGYELYSRMINTDLSPLDSEQRLTNAPYDSITPVAAFGPDGTLGILFRDDRSGGAHHVWFMRLGCVVPTP